jgi:hypothetical protein
MDEPDARPTPDPVFDDEPITLDDIRWVDALVFVLFWALAVVVFLQFFTRYVLNDSLGWSRVSVLLDAPRRAPRPPDPDRSGLGHLLRRARLALGAARPADQQTMVSIGWPKSVIYWTVAACFVAMTA